jgi:hypothetical protein
VPFEEQPLGLAALGLLTRVVVEGPAATGFLPDCEPRLDDLTEVLSLTPPCRRPRTSRRAFETNSEKRAPASCDGLPIDVRVRR